VEGEGGTGGPPVALGGLAQGFLRNAQPFLQSQEWVGSLREKGRGGPPRPTGQRPVPPILRHAFSELGKGSASRRLTKPSWLSYYLSL
jgi:hypothetical protein